MPLFSLSFLFTPPLWLLTLVYYFATLNFANPKNELDPRRTHTDTRLRRDHISLPPSILSTHIDIQTEHKIQTEFGHLPHPGQTIVAYDIISAKKKLTSPSDFYVLAHDVFKYIAFSILTPSFLPFVTKAKKQNNVWSKTDLGLLFFFNKFPLANYSWTATLFFYTFSYVEFDLRVSTIVYRSH